jgi:hypothetical protein
LVTFGLGIFLSQTRFRKIVDKFVLHILNLPDRSWVLSFQALKHYILLGTMMVLGLVLRHYSGLDVYYLAIIYMTMGTTLFFSSYFFYQQYLSIRSIDSESTPSVEDSS